MEASDADTQIRRALENLPGAFWHASWGERTRVLKNAIGGVGARAGFTVYAKDCDYRDNGEWLFDMTWLSDRDGYMVDSFLILESEWLGGNELSNDFQKLLIGRADLRVFICSARNLEAARSIVDDRLREIRTFAKSAPQDRYLIAAYVEDQGAFTFWSLSAGDYA